LILGQLYITREGQPALPGGRLSEMLAALHPTANVLDRAVDMPGESDHALAYLVGRMGLERGWVVLTSATDVDPAQAGSYVLPEPLASTKGQPIMTRH
jgi:hypothetical protein